MQRAQESASNAERLAAEYYRNRDPDLRDQLIESQLYIAKIIARKFSGRGVDYDDLFQVASMALFKATERYDPAHGVKFSSFVTPSMVGEVKNYFRDRSRTIRLPRNGTERLARLEKAREALTASLMRSPTAQELAENMHVSLEDVLEALEIKGAMQMQSLDASPETDDDAAPLSAFLGVEERGFSNFENNDTIRRAMNTLPPRERDVVRLRFFENLSQRETSQRLHISQMTVSRVERKALSALKKALDGMGDIE